MPTYIFKNKKTDEVFEQQMRISELDAFKKTNPDLVQLPTAPSFRLKGTGWYETDFKTGKKKNIAKSDNESQNKQKSSDKSDANKASS
jgi:predicted nucleic acid-binding Zn ribbon protein|tara:strand:+ start:201 stop:464 length:264 start_codon:yes stop_codon:yes gene_type:complete